MALKRPHSMSALRSLLGKVEVWRSGCRMNISVSVPLISSGYVRLFNHLAGCHQKFRDRESSALAGE